MSNLKTNCFQSEVEIVLAKNDMMFSTFKKRNYKGGVVMAPSVKPLRWGIPGTTPVW